MPADNVDMGAVDGEIQAARAAWDENASLRLLYGGSIVVQLGSKLYPSVTASLAELVSNAWDADASRVSVDVPLGDDWDLETAYIEVVDDGVGMSREEAQFQYLVVGRERRRASGKDVTANGRPLHGRKGIGKLAAFGTARTLEVTSKKRGFSAVAFRIDYEALRAKDPGQSSPVDELDPAELPPLTDRDGRELEHGTRVRLTDLQAKRKPSEERLMTSMRRRFALDEREMNVEINGETLTRFDMDFALRFPPARLPAGVTVHDGFAHETIPYLDGSTRDVRWWIGFTEKPVRDELLQGLTVIVRGKQAQRGFKFERTRGTEGQLGYEYLVGEVHADWIDDGTDEDDDLISSDRDTLQLEDERLQSFVDWGQDRLRWALRERAQLLQAEKVARWQQQMPKADEVLQQVSRREQRALGQVAERLARMEGVDDAAVADVMTRVLEVREHRAVAHVVEEIRSVGDAGSARTWERAAEVAQLEQRVLSETVQARIALLAAVAELAEEGEPMSGFALNLAANPWLIDLALDRRAVRTLEGLAPAGGLLMVVAAPPWSPESAPSLVVADWSAGRARTDEWRAALDTVAGEGPFDEELLVGISLPTARSWDDALRRSTAQHEEWARQLGPQT